MTDSNFAFLSIGKVLEEPVCLYGLLDAGNMLILVVIEGKTSEIFEV
jgi:hypothetical protein